MPAWNDLHYARAGEFARLIAGLTAPGPVSVEAPAPVPARPVLPEAPPAVPPVPTLAAAAKPAVPPANGPTAGAVFKKIPWKK